MKKRDYFYELGVQPLVNAAGTYTSLTASLMLPEVLDAMDYASKSFCRLGELHDAVGVQIAKLLGAEGAMVTAGAASALTLGTAACLTGNNAAFVRQIPDLAGMKSEVLIQKSHRFGYDRALRNCGVTMVEFETAAQAMELAGADTALMLFFNAANNRGVVKEAEFADLGLRLGVPTFIDCAADVPPVTNLTKHLNMGFSLVTFSGGKGIRGPQSAGVLLGRKDLIDAARMNASPNGDAIGRGMKVNKEEMLGMLVAIECYLGRDHDADWKEWERRIEVIKETLSEFPALEFVHYIPDIANQVPHLRVNWDQEKFRITYDQVKEKLRNGAPSIEVVPGAEESLSIAVWMLQAGEELVVADSICKILASA